jgi:hypothetical protein
MPYGMMRNEEGKWFCFNRDYLPLGWNDYQALPEMREKKFTDLPVYGEMKGLTEKRILAIGRPDSVHRNDKGEITQFYFYNDKTNPMNDPKEWGTYLDRIKKISDYKVN